LVHLQMREALALSIAMDMLQTYTVDLLWRSSFSWLPVWSCPGRRPKQNYPDRSTLPPVIISLRVLPVNRLAPLPLDNVSP